MLSALRRMPAPLLVAQLGAVAISVYWLARSLLDGGFEHDDSTYATLLAGSWLALFVLSAVGLARLARRLSGAAQAGARIAVAATLAAIAVQITHMAVMVYTIVTGDDLRRASWTFSNAAGSTATLLFAVGVGLAARRWYLIVAGAVVAVLTNPPWFLARAMFSRITDSLHGYAVLLGALGVVWTVSMFVIAMLACRDTTPNEEPRMTTGLNRIALALHGLAVATVVLVIFVLFLELTDASPTILMAQHLAIVFATLLGLAALIVLALGALDVTGWLMIASASASLCVAGRMVGRLAELAQRYFYRLHGDLANVYSFGPREPTFIPAISSQLLTTGAIAGVLVAIAVAARRRGLDHLRARVMVNAGLFVGLSLGATTGQRLIADVSDLTPLGVVIMIGTNAALVASWLIAARVVRRAGTELAGEANLPVAKLVNG
jgi:hypothetical protein